jgi:hypothetical protein
MAVFWVRAPCKDWFEFTDVSEVCTASIALMIEAAQTSETLVNLQQSTRRYNPEYSHLQMYVCIRDFSAK